MYTCSTCNFNCVKRGDWNRHVRTPKHLQCTAPLNTLEFENERLKALVLEQQTEIKKQCKPCRKTFHLHDFLKTDCCNALDWPDFVSSVVLCSTASDISSQIANSINDAAKTAGLHKRALHCLDHKRRKLCLKLNGDWVYDTPLVERTIEDSLEQLQSALLQQSNKWLLDHPDFADNDTEMTKYVELVNYLSAPIDYSKFYSLVANYVTIPKM